MTGTVPLFRRRMHGGMQLQAERFPDDETLQPVELAGWCASGKSVQFAATKFGAFAHLPLRHSGAGALRANLESRHRAPLLDSGSAPKRAHPGMTNQGGCASLHAGCGKASPTACLMLHLRSRYVSKAAILTVPVFLVLVENRSPA
jgi:hypothetical protein